ncbi:MAG: HEAT repeat domain-containing protein [Terracidiphilus sp.]|jgi:HEAT repeat protein
MGLVKQKIIQLAERGKRNDERECGELAAALEGGNAAGRRQAAREIIRCLGAAKTLVSRLKREEDLSVREVILNTLLGLNDPSAVSGLVDCLRSEDAALRNEVIEAFKKMGSEVDPVLHSLLADSDADVRIFVVNILDSQRHPEAESWLIKVIEQDSHVNVCATAVDLLCEVASEAAVDPLLRLKARFQSEPYIQFAADLALKRIREA